jgi:hypothetical protein
MVVQDSNPSYLGGRDGENQDSRPAQAKIFMTHPFQSVAGCGIVCLSFLLQGEV